MTDIADAAATLGALRDAPVHILGAAVELRRTADVVRLRRVDLASEARDFVAEQAATFRDDLADRVLVEYEWGRNLEDHEAAVVPIEEAPDAEALTAALDRLTTYDRLDLTRRESGAARLFLTDTSFATGRNSQTRLVFVRTRVRSEIITRSKRLALVFAQGQYDVVDANQLVLHNHYDAAIVDGRYIVGLNRRKLEDAFRFTERIEQAASEAMDRYVARLRIANFAALKAACQSHPGMARKAASIGRKMDVPAYAAAMNMDSILAFIEQHPEVGVDVRGAPEGPELVHDDQDPAGRWSILKLLDDDYLTSELTNFFYEAPSKNEP